MVQRRQQPGQATCQHGFSGTRRPAQQQVVLAGGSHQQGPLCGQLTLHLVQVRQLRRGFRQTARVPRGQRVARIQVIDQLLQVFDGVEGQAGDQRGFFGVGCGHHQAVSRLACSQCCRQYSPDRPHLAGQPKLAQQLQLRQLLRQDLAAGSQQGGGNGQVVTAAVFGQVGRRQTQGDAFLWKTEIAVDDCAAYTVLAFTYVSFRQANQAQ